MEALVQWWQAGLWGALGAALVEVADFQASLKERRKLPWKGRNAASLGLYSLAALLRMLLGVGVAVALGESGQVSGGFGAILAGIAAPKILEALQTQAAPGRSIEPAADFLQEQNTVFPSQLKQEGAVQDAS
ncbi:hypothetical protein [Kitasatospora sp. NPDC001547]|uniref:hypothetical protein n=1 Tax=Kitasatospora sp. NPDC001547 TaxID=3364015 RepID=UPI0036D0B58E|nr:hypothetical protein KitaXyl93_42600 [Kitasatospora sp. Xyl93]